ncbi:MAG: hypothetical protein KAX98_10670 [Nitrospira sp.]|nr:hypothetical protein [Nitrospira sp.]
MRVRYPLLSPDEGFTGSSGGGADPAPQETLPADSSTEDSVNWDAMDSSFNDEEVETVEGAEEVIPLAEEPARVSEPVAAEIPAVPATVQAPPTPQVPAAPVPETPAEPTPSYTEWRTQRLTQLEQMYALDEASAVAALTEPENVLPKLAAKVHLDVLESSMRAMQAMLPTVLGQIQQGSELNTRAKNLFTSVNPDLVDPQYEGAIMQLGQVYRSMNKAAPPEEAARAIGSLVRAAYGIVQQPAAAPTLAPRQNPAGMPFTPARGAGGISQGTVSNNPFEQLAAEMEKEDW